MSEAIILNRRQGVVLDDIARFWKDDKVGNNQPCLFFVDIRGASFHVLYSNSESGRQERDTDFSKLAELI